LRGPTMKALDAREPEFEVKSGDTLVVDRVEPVKQGDQFDHMHDVEMRRAYLRVKRKRGKDYISPHPLAFYRSDVIAKPIHPVQSLSAIRNRILEK